MMICVLNTKLELMCINLAQSHFLANFGFSAVKVARKDRLDFQLFIEDFIEDYIQYLKYYISIQGEQSEQESM